ncbi:MAG TPA: antibiotic biosynthesis monooxygenase [Chloroflexota bacterium]|nr:antibiotic biosynthesis monooxygenase [Chloroflexota bacterium]
MFTYHLHARVKSPQDVPEICRLFHHNLQLIQEPGWRGGGCMVDVDDACTLLIYENWGSLAALKAWQTTVARKIAYQVLENQIEGEPRVAIYRDVA